MVTSRVRSARALRGEPRRRGSAGRRAPVARSAQAVALGATLLAFPACLDGNASYTPGNGTSDTATDATDGSTSDDPTTTTTPTSSEGPTTAPPAECGNGVVEAGEACDDGGVDSERCDADCTAASCGDRHVNAAAGEDCDEGGDDSETCDADCTVPECGDAYVNVVVGEDCDPGLAENTEECDADCTVVVCGDAHVNEAAGEACDAGGDDALCDADCTAPECGDLYVNPAAGEDCDTEEELDHAVCEACVLTCEGFTGNCNNDPMDGCEVNLAADLAHCGMCEMACSEEQVCFAGICE